MFITSRLSQPAASLISRYSGGRRKAGQTAPVLRTWSPAFIALLALLSPGLALAQASPDLGSAAPYALLGTNPVATSGTVTCVDTGPGTEIDGDVGSTFNTISNSGCSITGSIDAPVAAQVIADFDAAYAAIDGLNPCTGVIPTVTSTLPPGVYCSAAGTTLGAGVILTLDGTPSDVWVFRVGTGGLGALTLTSAQVVMDGAADACNVFWKTAEAATLTDSDFVGTILSGAAISMTNGSWFGRGLASTDVTVTDAAPMAFASCAAPAAVTVAKDFSDDNPATVQVELSCTSGVVSGTPQDASEAIAAEFLVGSADPGATCTATELAPPAGYAVDESDCENVPLGGSCTIVNTLVGADETITVIKDFIPDSAASVAVSLSCTSGTIGATPLDASEAAPAVFNVTTAALGTTCTAIETVPDGYIADQSDCLNVPLGGTCTITNTLIEPAATITVFKDFIPNSPAVVEVELNCTSGSIAANPLDASEAAEAVFVIDAAANGTTCTAIESVPDGYIADQTDCIDVPLGGSCTIVNTLIEPAATITVFKDFIPNSAAPVQVELTCTSGTIAASPLDASEATEAVFGIVAASDGTTCTALEVVPAGYVADQSDCVDVEIGGSCTITNRLSVSAAPATIPTASVWVLLGLAMLLAGVGVVAIRR